MNKTTGTNRVALSTAPADSTAALNQHGPKTQGGLKWHLSRVQKVEQRIG
jgi:hypothetical protein